jgi:hypothetical protein
LIQCCSHRGDTWRNNKRCDCPTDVTDCHQTCEIEKMAKNPLSS